MSVKDGGKGREAPLGVFPLSHMPSFSFSICFYKEMRQIVQYRRGKVRSWEPTAQCLGMGESPSKQEKPMLNKKKLPLLVTIRVFVSNPFKKTRNSLLAEKLGIYPRLPCLLFYSSPFFICHDHSIIIHRNSLCLHPLPPPNGCPHWERNPQLHPPNFEIFLPCSSWFPIVQSTRPATPNSRH